LDTADVAGTAWVSTTISHGVPEMAGELVSFMAPDSREADQYRALRYGIERRHQDDGLKVFAVTSPAPAEGKTVTCVNLAGALAQARSRRVLLVDADFHQATVATYLGLDNSRGIGLADAIRTDGATLAHAVQRIDALNLSVLLPGMFEGSAYELLNSPRFEALLKEARTLYDYILVDTPPVMVLPDARVIGRCVDGFVLVVCAHKTRRRAVAESLDLLDRSKIIGTVLNGDRRRETAYANYYKRRDAMKLDLDR
jgi:capsular exopolysaccharide synthesis family protein